MIYAPPLVTGMFLERLNRFAGRAQVEGQDTLVHIPNSGRMTELLVAGAPAGLAKAPEGTRRKTAYDLTLIGHRGRWVGVDSRAPTPLFLEAWRAGRLDAFARYTDYRREVAWGGSRFDLQLEGGGRPCLVETKSVNLVESGTAMFPDAPTQRGTRHLEHLAAALREGYDAAVAFIVQRDDARRLVPFEAADPDFAAALRAARAAGVAVFAYTCTVSLEGMELAGEIPVEL